MFKLPILRDGWVTASQMTEVFEALIDAATSRINDDRAEFLGHVERLESENRELRHRVEFLERQSRSPYARVNLKK